MALLGGMIASLVSLPLTWFTLKSTMGDMTGMPGLGGAMSFSVSANGFKGLLFGIPIWLVMLVAAGAGLLQYLRAIGKFEAPPAAEWGTAIGAAAILALGMIRLITAGLMPGIGMLLGLAGAAVPIVCLAMPTQGGETSSDKFDS